MKKISKVIDTLFIISAMIAIIEFLFIRGIFTGICACIVLGVIGLTQTILSIIKKKYYKAIMAVLVCIAVLSGYYIVIN